MAKGPSNNYPSPPVIWLQPWCQECDETSGEQGRLWAEDDPWGKCEECGRKPVKYIRKGE